MSGHNQVELKMNVSRAGQAQKQLRGRRKRARARIRLAASAVVVGMMCALSGCASPAVIAAAAATAGFTLAQGQAEAYINGKLKAARMVSLQEGYEATLTMADELKLDVKEKYCRKTEAYVRAQAKDGPSIKVTLQAKSPMITKFIIRVGLMGDQAVSSLVFWRIDSHLPASAKMAASAPAQTVPVVMPPVVPGVEPAPEPVEAPANKKDSSAETAADTRPEEE
ncbi:MAG TPA: DUF3568 family protein [Phycisphaerales bacterium]|nr:DUF3568 family protein [Phycisphaerales bacterium]